MQDGDHSSLKGLIAVHGLDASGEENGDEQASSGDSDQEGSAGKAGAHGSSQRLGGRLRLPRRRVAFGSSAARRTPP